MRVIDETGSAEGSYVVLTVKQMEMEKLVLVGVNQETLLEVLREVRVKQLGVRGVQMSREGMERMELKGVVREGRRV